LNMNTTEIAKAYDAVVDAYASVRSPTVGVSHVDRLCDRLPEGSSVLDVGCGTGIPLASHLVDRGFRIHGLDISPRMLEKARESIPGASFELADILSWTATRPYDGILAWDTLFHLPPREHLPALTNLHHALVPGGTALLTFGGSKGEIRSTMLGREFYYSSLSPEEYTEALERIGFDVVSLERDQPGEEHIVIFAERRANEALTARKRFLGSESGPRPTRTNLKQH
jgi:SAM-dependent methyltransferase